MQMQSKERGADLYLNYHQILEAKKHYPENMNIKDKSAKVPLQSLLNHTTTRILEILQSILTVTDKSLLDNVELIAKWGLMVLLSNLNISKKLNLMIVIFLLHG